VAKAKRRGGPRPRSVNTPADHQQSSFKWVDPLPEPIEVDFPFNLTAKKDYGIRFEVDPLLPDTISEPYIEALEGLMFRTDQKPEVQEDLKKGLKAQAAFACAKKLFSTLDPVDASALQPLKAVWYDDAEIPTTMSRLVDSIGNFDSQLGGCKYRHPRTTFMRWMSLGLKYAGDLGSHESLAGLDAEIHRTVWDDDEGLAIVHDRANSEMRSLREATHDLTISGTKFKCSLPDPAEATSAEISPFPENVKHQWLNTKRCMALKKEDLIANASISASPIPIDASTFLDATVGLVARSTSLDIASLKASYEAFRINYTKRVAPHLKAYFRLSPMPKGNRGYSSQLITGEKYALRSPLPQSDADLANGFILNALRSIEIVPEYVSYSKITRSNAAASVAAKSLSDLAH